ncbi:hypothetical protein CLV63_11293 [Murinocardiopsis flavida]|uniref:Uncharacterized protein n=1 Tax=Murinocardiopsis flavida TaxID=645275 RepID=A0A2P8DG69_9ACTN|nr:hypothetical protein CLV63_11293 [Murinocardiopsis flavida]
MARGRPGHGAGSVRGLERDDTDHPGYRIRISATLYADLDPAGRISILCCIWGPGNVVPTRSDSPRYAARALVAP